jgi:hypothetical protein
MHASNVSMHQKRYADIPIPVLNLDKGRLCLWLRKRFQSGEAGWPHLIEGNPTSTAEGPMRWGGSAT